MTDTARKKWERVATRIGVWKPKQKCECDEFSDPDADLEGQRWCEACHFLALDPCCPVVPHDIPCPDPSDPVMIVALLEWCIKPKLFKHTTIVFGHKEWEQLWYDLRNKELHAALIDAIDALPED